MKITCQSCQAKYTIADEKVLGKIVKIRCKKCSSTIVVNGSDASGAAVYGAQETAGAAGGDEGWTVNVGEGDQRTMSDAEIVSAFQS
ncbi:MAG TPA: zinc-ribbon domain-containing protein, partial [Polyangiaceae bacterium]|nr:zinc-ribbon domain-containing protein [Polyangiaceae bacterium]